MTPQVRPATADDAASIATRLREADRLELSACGVPPVESLLLGVAAGRSFVWATDGEPCVLFGANEIDPKTASIWLVGTPALEQHQRYLLRQARSWVDAFNADWPLLVNYADARNTLHHRFIRWAGFTFFAERQVNGLRFLDFARIRT